MLRSKKMLLKGEHAPYFPLSIYPSSAPASCISMHIVHVPLVVLVLILFCLFDLVCRCNPHRKLDEILLRRLGIILFNSGVRDQTKLSGEKKGFQIHVAIFFLFFFFNLLPFIFVIKNLLGADKFLDSKR